MSDLASRLRGTWHDWRSDYEIMQQAADELDRLNAQALELCAEISKLRRERQEWRSRMGLKVTDDVVRENERLRELLRDNAPWVHSIDAALAGAAVQPKPVRFSLDEEYDDPPATSDQQSVGS